LLAILGIAQVLSSEKHFDRNFFVLSFCCAILSLQRFLSNVCILFSQNHFGGIHTDWGKAVLLMPPRRPNLTIMVCSYLWFCWMVSSSEFYLVGFQL